MKKQLRQAGVTGMIVASLAAGPGIAAASSSPGRPTRERPASVYQMRLSALSQALEHGQRELELQLTKLAGRRPRS